MGRDKAHAREREAMVADQIAARGVKDQRVLAALRTVPRHLFIPEDLEGAAYADSPLPIGDNQTISQPYIVGYMSEAAQIRPGDRVLEIGTGCGYQTAVLAELAREVYTIEIVPRLAASARAIFDKPSLSHVRTRQGDGYAGWPEAAPFDVIIVTAAPGHIPAPLTEQLAVGGRLVIPVGTGHQSLIRVTKDEKGRLSEESLLPVSFVPMTGKAGTKRH